MPNFRYQRFLELYYKHRERRDPVTVDLIEALDDLRNDVTFMADLLNRNHHRLSITDADAAILQDIVNEEQVKDDKVIKVGSGSHHS